MNAHQSKVRTGRFLTSHVVASKQPKRWRRVLRYSAVGRAAPRQLSRRVRNWVALQGQFRCFYCIVDYTRSRNRTSRPRWRGARAPWRSTYWRARRSGSRDAVRAVGGAGAHRAGLGTVGGGAVRRARRMTQFKDKAEHQPDNINAGCSPTRCCRRRTSCSTARRASRRRGPAPAPELAREIVRASTRASRHVREPQPLFSTTPKILGLDGRPRCRRAWATRSRSTNRRRDLGQAAHGRDRSGARQAHRSGHPEKCNIYTLHKFFSNEDRQKEVTPAAPPPASAASTARRCCLRA